MTVGTWGVGMPAALYLEEFGSQVWAAFGEPPYMVGSATKATVTRDVDVRVMLDDEAWAKLFPDLPPDRGEETWHRNAKWVALTLAFSALGEKITGLPIDFQVQPARYANDRYPLAACPRNPLGRVPLRYSDTAKSV